MVRGIAGRLLQVGKSEQAPVKVVENPEQDPQPADAALEPIAGGGETVHLECELAPQIRPVLLKDRPNQIPNLIGCVAQVGDGCLAAGRRIAVPANDLAARLPDHLQNRRGGALIGLSWHCGAAAPNGLLDSLDRREHTLGIGTTVALGVFVQEPAAPPSGADGRANGIIVRIHARGSGGTIVGERIVRHGHDNM
ncbi:MAG: hypothetical protein GEU91_23775 [Rhizobiales bacterium]|nr:hypothetical protein [Hyphomicrobiales bacterium]